MLQLVGEVEADETYTGGKHRRKDGYSKEATVFGMVERHGKVTAKHVKSSGACVLLPEIAGNIRPGTQVYSDEWRAYSKLKIRDYIYYC